MKHTLVLLFQILTAAGDGETTEPENLPPVIMNLSETAESGDPKAQIQMGMRYRDGDGVVKDHREALKWFRKCADQGCPEGMDNVGFMHLSGWGVPVDFGTAAAYFKASAAQDHA